MHQLFKLVGFVVLLFVAPGMESQANAPFHQVDKAKFYTVLAGNDLGTLNRLLDELQSASIPEKNAYQGALLMKKAGLVKKPSEKLSLFKSGRNKLESAIREDLANVEYHFLRLVIQEHAPKIVKYKANLASDAEMIRNDFKKLSPAVQQAVRDYSKNSAVLKPSDL